jgi:NTE family protein
MTKALPLSGESEAPQRVPFERVVLVLQGGGALGAYQGGVYQALHEAKIEVSWICGTSIGGINGALIAGNRPERRVERLREFWDAITRPPIGIPDPALFAALSWKGSGPAHLTDRLSGVSSMLYGVPDFFTPRPFPPLIAAAERPDLVSCYDTAPLRATLARLVDFDLINSKSVRFSVAAPTPAPKRPSISTTGNTRSHRRTSWRARLCYQASRPLKSTANIIGMALWCRTRRCNT